jgi:hypothetical protein
MKMAALLIFGFSVNAWAKAECSIPDRQLSHYQQANAEADAKAAIAAGKLSFVGVYGFTLFTPGISEEELQCYSSQIPTRGIEGTSDFIECQSQLSLDKVASIYAERFNKIIIAAARSQGLRCGSNNSFKADSLRERP